MSIPSRCMPEYEASSKSMILPYGFISILISGYIYGVWQEPMQGLVLTIFILIIIVVSAFLPYKYDCTYFNALVNERENEDIGSFARSLDYRTIDTWVIRAVYEELNDEIYCNENRLPIRASDRLDEDLGLGDDDLFYLYNRNYLPLCLLFLQSMQQIATYLSNHHNSFPYHYL